MQNSLAALSKDELLALVECLAKNMVALDGVWFQACEKSDGMDKAMVLDEAVWNRFAFLEARRFKAFLKLPEQPGLAGLRQALPLHFNSIVNEAEMVDDADGALVFRTITCRVQQARSRQNMPWHPCRPVGLAEYSAFARGIDERIRCEAISCYPVITDSSCACSWRFTLAANNSVASAEHPAEARP